MATTGKAEGSSGRAASRYLAALAASALLFLAGTGALLRERSRQGLLPPLPLTGSISFDEKAAFVRDALSGQHDVIVAGSSMALNNFASDVFSEEMPGHPAVLDIGAWSMKIADTRRWLNRVLQYQQPRRVILLTAPMDFYAPDGWLNNVSDHDLDAFFSNSALSFALFMRRFSADYYETNWNTMRDVRFDRSRYDSLQFDGGGSVPLEVYYPHIDQTRWDEVTDGGLLRDDQYEELGLLAEELRSHGIELIVARAPMRKRARDMAHVVLERHWQRVHEAVTGAGQSLWDAGYEIDFDDDWFADYSHLNAKGAAAFTRLLIRHLQ
jgi:hypothetical protein